MHVLSAIHWPEKLRNMNYAHWYDPCPGSPPHHRWCPQMGGGGKTTADNNKPPGPMTEPHRDVGSVVGLRSSKEIVASFGWLEDLPMLVNRLQFFIFFNSFSYFSCQLCQFLLAQLATAHRCWAQFVFMKWFIIWGRRPARLDRNQHCEVEIQHAEIHRDETSRASILQSTATSSRGTGSRSHLHLGRKRGICWFPISWGKAGRSENLQSENSSLFIVVEVFNKSARVGAMEKRHLPVRSRIRKPEPASGTIHTFWSALWRRRMWNHCRGIFSTPPLRSLGDVVGSLPRRSLPLMAQSKETRHRLKLVWKDSVVFESRRFECLLKFIKKSIFPREYLRIKGTPNWSSWLSSPSKILQETT